MGNDEQVIAYGAETARKLAEIENKDEVLSGLRRKQAAAAEEYLKLARAVVARRFEAARALEKLAEAEMADLAMKARFKIEVSGSEERSRTGRRRVSTAWLT